MTQTEAQTMLVFIGMISAFIGIMTIDSGHKTVGKTILVFSTLCVVPAFFKLFTYAILG